MKEFNIDNDPKIHSGFSFPEGYFDSVSEKILKQTTKNKPKVVSLFSRRKSISYAAAAVVILFLSIPFYNHFDSTNEDMDTIALEEYIAYRSSISEEEIVNLLDNEEVEKLNLDFNIQDKEIEEALDSNSNLEQYILD